MTGKLKVHGAKLVPLLFIPKRMDLKSGLLVQKPATRHPNCSAALSSSRISPSFLGNPQVYVHAKQVHRPQQH